MIIIDEATCIDLLDMKDAIPQQASGQRMVCMRPGCSVDVRRGTVVLTARDLVEGA